MARGGVGSNQYQTRGVSRAGQVATLSGDEARAALGQRQCGDVWGTKCKAWVSAPDWAHGKHPSPRSKQMVAHTSSDPEMIRHFSEDRVTRVWVSYNPNLPADIIEDMISSGDHKVLIGIAGNPGASPSTLAQLASSADSRVRQRLVHNSNTPSDILRDILPELSGEDRKATALSLDVNTLPEMDRLFVRYAAHGLRNDVPSRALGKLADYPDEYIRGRVAAHPNTPPGPRAE